MPLRDPKTYVPQRPLPIPEQKGLRILARDFLNYNCARPTREQVFFENYARRTKQIREQGYRSVNHKPYQNIGGPLILDEEELIRTTLGLGNEQLDNEKSTQLVIGQTGGGVVIPDVRTQSGVKGSSGKDKDDLTIRRVKSAPPLSRKLTEINIMNKAISEGRQKINSVKLGHSLFQMIQKEENAKLSEVEVEQRKQIETARHQMRPPPSSSDEESDDEIYVDVRSFFDVDYTQKTSTPATPLRPQLYSANADKSDTKSVIFSELNATFITEPHAPESVTTTTSGYNTDSRANSAMTSSSSRQPTKTKQYDIVDVDDKVPRHDSSVDRPIRTPTRKKRVEPVSRPFTPKYLCICSEDTFTETDKQALFRQLCALIWILESLAVEAPFVMTPIATCWNLKDLGGCKVTKGKVHKEKLTETKWDHFVTTQHGPKGPKRSSRQGNRLKQVPPTRVHRTPSTQSSVLSLNHVAPYLNHVLKDSGSGEDVTGGSSPKPTGDNTDEHDKVLTHLDEVNESVSGDGTEMSELPTTGPLNTGRNSRVYIHRRESRASITVSVTGQDDKFKGDTMVQAWVQQTIPPKRVVRKAWTFRSVPMSSSKKWENLASDLRQKFLDTVEEKTLTLKDSLDAFERRKLVSAEKKFVAITATSDKSDFYKDMDTIRNIARETQQDQQNRSQEQFCKWYLHIMGKLPPGFTKTRHYQQLMEKLEFFGTLGNIESRKVTPKEFVRILSSLRPWELRSPDIKSAIEFARGRIVEMSEFEFQQWVDSVTLDNNGLSR